MISFICGIEKKKKVQLTEAESRPAVTMGPGWDDVGLEVCSEQCCAERWEFAGGGRSGDPTTRTWRQAYSLA